jgi:hypothetical protein
MNDAPTADAGPGFLAFVAFFVLALALWFLMRNMNSRMRRMSYRQQLAHRGKDDPQVGPGEVVRDERDGGDGAGGPAGGADGPAGGPDDRRPPPAPGG